MSVYATNVVKFSGGMEGVMEVVHRLAGDKTRSMRSI